MINHENIVTFFIVLGMLSACTANSKTYSLSDKQAQSNRTYTTQLQQKDRDIDHLERLRRAEAIARATRNAKGSVIIIPDMLIPNK